MAAARLEALAATRLSLYSLTFLCQEGQAFLERLGH